MMEFISFIYDFTWINGEGAVSPQKATPVGIHHCKNDRTPKVSVPMTLNNKFISFVYRFTWTNGGSVWDLKWPLYKRLGTPEAKAPLLVPVRWAFKKHFLDYSGWQDATLNNACKSVIAWCDGRERWWTVKRFSLRQIKMETGSVSYTHLTLPTILRV